MMLRVTVMHSWLSKSPNMNPWPNCFYGNARRCTSILIRDYGGFDRVAVLR